ncbi:MAG TPA: putative peptidoglycan glycosyltransferase FtsW [Gemmatimonadaceae bacterium]|jgi:cell division protein FtsW|nr:putative peptidoglycan glycosyltransferase FtsW [Gemmatimonadaceae bacterium]
MEASVGLRHRWTMGVEARVLVILTGVLLAFGVATVYSASAIVEMQAGQGHAYLLLRQLTGMAVGALLFAIAAKLDAELWEKWAWPLMALSLVLLIVVILPFTATIAPRIHGSRRYLFGASLQPSELAKLAVVLWTSMLVVKKGLVMRRLTKGLLPFLVVIGALDILVMLEPDLSTAMMFTLVMGIILFAGGVRIGHFVALGVLLIPLLYVKIERLNYVLLRMTAFFDPGGAPPEVSYQLRQSLIAVGSGQIFGVGFGRGRQQYGFLPFGYDDFIAGHIGEEWGFVGLALLVLAFALYAAVGFRIARKARTPFLQLVAVGLTVTTVLTAYLHIGVATGLLPTTGLTLPFISYGRSNLVLSLLMTGIVVNIGSRRERVFGEAATDPLALRALPAR